MMGNMLLDNGFNTVGLIQFVAIYQTTFSNAFSVIKMYEFRLRNSLFLSFELTVFPPWFRYWLGADKTTSRGLNQ